MPAIIPPPPPSLRIASHVRACCSDGQVVLLDLRRNKYLGFGGRHALAFCGDVRDWPSDGLSSHDDAASTAVLTLRRQLLAQGVLTDRPSEVRFDSTLEEATASMDFEPGARDLRIGARRLVRFLRSSANAAAWMRFRTLDSIASAVAARRDRVLARGASAASVGAIVEVAAAYERLRPLVFTAHDKCLQDSLALVAFMASEGLVAQWVVGVRTRPFGAHSWVQSGGTVLNDQHDHVRRFSPILVI